MRNYRGSGNEDHTIRVPVVCLTGMPGAGLTSDYCGDPAEPGVHNYAVFPKFRSRDIAAAAVIHLLTTSTEVGLLGDVLAVTDCVVAVDEADSSSQPIDGHGLLNDSMYRWYVALAKMFFQYCSSWYGLRTHVSAAGRLTD